ncbi:MAG: hypothetical protein JRF07_05300 [Deltaproteobacteria bacterium]|nr:hypothetical protein [Deltaproteobacteria bacterium]
MKLTQETAEALVRLSNNRDFIKIMDWFDEVHGAFIQGAVMGVDENYSPDVLRGRAQALSILKAEIEKAPQVVGRIQKIS